MNWDEKAEDYAGAHHTYEHRSPEDNRLIEKEIVHGARWQRDQLRTDEAVERVARGIAQAHGLVPELWHQYEGVARAAITALIGEEP